MSMYNTISGRNTLTDSIFETIGLEHKNPQTEEEKELCDISFLRFRDIMVMENFSLIKITTRTGGGNRLDYKENIRDIRDHSLYVDDCDWSVDNTYAWWYLRVPEPKRDALRVLYPKDYVPLKLNREFSVEDKVWNRLNNPNYVDSESDTDYSDEEDFSSRYGYWYHDEGESETDDGMSGDEMEDDSNENNSTPMEM